MPSFRRSTVLLAGFVVAGTIGLTSRQRPVPPPDATTRAVTAAEAFLVTLDEKQRLKANIESELTRPGLSGRTCPPGASSR